MLLPRVCFCAMREWCFPAKVQDSRPWYWWTDGMQVNYSIFDGWAKILVKEFECQKKPDFSGCAGPPATREKLKYFFNRNLTLPAAPGLRRPEQNFWKSFSLDSFQNFWRSARQARFAIFSPVFSLSHSPCSHRSRWERRSMGACVMLFYRHKCNVISGQKT